MRKGVIKIILIAIILIITGCSNNDLESFFEEKEILINKISKLEEEISKKDEEIKKLMI